MSIITEADRSFFAENGYVKLEGIVPEALCDAAVDAIWTRLGQDPTDPDTWYGPPEGMDEHWASRSGGMVELSHHQALWDNRQYPDLYQAFAEVLGKEGLWVTMDRVNMTPPRHPDHPELDRSFIHWDADISDVDEMEVQSSGTERVPYGVQGVLYLADIAENQGTFQCVPEIYRNITSWTDADRTLDEAELTEEIIKVPGQKGDLVIWDKLLAHGNGSNTADAPRFAQYISMAPEQFADREARTRRIETWRNRETFGEDPSGWEQEHLEPADLTPLGRKLLGLDPWPGWLRD